MWTLASSEKTKGGLRSTKQAGGARKMVRSCEARRIRARTSGERPGCSQGSITTPLLWMARALALTES